MQEPLVVGITGGSASGKTLFLDHLLKKFSKEELCLLPLDNYYKNREDQPEDENGVKNFDTPDSILLNEYISDIERLKAGEAFTRFEYTFNNPNVKPRELEFYPAPILVVEGLFIFYFEEIRNLIDLKIFIETEPYIKLKRRIIRDRNERGYDLEDVLYRFEKHVMPMYERYIEPYKNEADIIVPNNRNFNTGLDVITAFLQSKLKSEHTS
ncbi:MAG: uridine kinase [Bacteroidota bacterium]